MDQFLPLAIRDTRENAVRPAQGLRFGNFSGAIALPSVGPSHNAGQHAKEYFNNLQIYRKICEWFDSWMPWQKRLLLCGLTDRCSNNQLEYLSTALEPVFHRDYLTAVRGRYPTTPFKKTREDATVVNKKESVKPTKVKRERRQTATSQSERHRRLEKLVDGYVDNILKDAVEAVVSQESLKSQEEYFFFDQTEKFAKQFVDKVIATAVESVKELREQEASSTVSEKTVLRPPKSGTQTKTPSQLGEIGVVSSRPPSQSLRSHSRQSSRPVSHQSPRPFSRLLPFSCQSPRPPSELKKSQLDSYITQVSRENTLGNLPRPTSSEDTQQKTPEKVSRNILSRSEECKTMPSRLLGNRFEKTRHWSFDGGKPDNQLFSEQGKSPLDTLLYGDVDEQFNPFTKTTLHHRSSLVATPLSIFRQSPTYQHHHRSNINSANNLHASDFFDQQKIKKLGLMHGALRSGQIKKPNGIQDIHLPFQKTFKNKRWWGGKVPDGKHLIRAQNSQLKQYFKAQLNQVWEWMFEWEDHERGDLLVEVIKLCDEELIKFFAQCLLQRLRDRNSIDSVPDKIMLKVFTYLSPPEISIVSQVCRRWRYITAQDELWLVKCEEMGAREGVEDVAKLVQEFKRDYSIDWRLAYQELLQVTYHAKHSYRYLDQNGATNQYDDHGAVAGMQYNDYGPNNHGYGGELSETRRPKKLLGFRLEDVALKPASSALSTISSDADSHTSSDKSEQTKKSTEVVDIPLQQVIHVSASISREASEGRYVTDMQALPQTANNDSSDSETEIFMDEDSPFPQHLASQASRRTLYSRRTTIYSDRRTSTRERKSRASTHRKSLQSPKSPDRVEEILPDIPSEEKLIDSKPATRQNKRLRRKIKDEDEEDMALDIRPELYQAVDLLGKSMSNQRLEWRKEDGRTIKHTKFAGLVKGVKRVRKLQGHMDAVHCLAFDNRRIISGSLDRTIRVWDIRSGRSIRKMYGHKGGVLCIQFDTERIISGSWDMTIMVWDIIKFNRLAVLTGHKGSVSDIKFNSKILVSASHDTTVRVWSLENYSCTNVLEGHTDAVTCISFDGTIVVSGSTDRTIRVTNVFTGECLITLTGHKQPITALEVQGDLVLSGTFNGNVFFWNIETGENEAGVKLHESSINKIHFLPMGPSGTRFMTASHDSIVKEWDLNTMTCVRQLHGHKGPVRDVKISEDHLVSCSDDGNLRIWDLMTPLLKPPDDSHGKTIPMHTIKQGEN